MGGITTLFPLWLAPETYGVSGNGQVEEAVAYLTSLLAAGEEGQEVQLATRHARFTALRAQCAALAFACSEEADGRRAALAKLDRQSRLGEGNFGAPAPGRNADEREARRQLALDTDLPTIRHRQALAYWRSREEHCRVLVDCLSADLRRYELLLGRGT